MQPEEGSSLTVLPTFFPLSSECFTLDDDDDDDAGGWLVSCSFVWSLCGLFNLLVTNLLVYCSSNKQWIPSIDVE